MITPVPRKHTFSLTIQKVSKSGVHIRHVLKVRRTHTTCSKSQAYTYDMFKSQAYTCDMFKSQAYTGVCVCASCDRELQLDGIYSTIHIGKGGVAIMWHKKHNNSVTPLCINDDRIIGVQYQVSASQFLHVF